MLKQVPEQDIESAILYFQLVQVTRVQQGGAPGREGEDATTAETLGHATMGQSCHPSFPVAGTDEEEKSLEAFTYKVSPGLKTRNKASHVMFQNS